MKPLSLLFACLFSVSIHAQMNTPTQYTYAAAFVMEGGTAKDFFGKELNPLWRVYLCLENSRQTKEMDFTLRPADLGSVFQTWVGNSNPSDRKYYQLREMKLSFPYESYLVEAGDYMYPELILDFNSIDMWEQITGSHQESYPSKMSIIQFSWNNQTVGSGGIRYFDNQDKSISYLAYGVQKTVKTPENGIKTTSCEGQNQAIVVERLDGRWKVVPSFSQPSALAVIEDPGLSNFYPLIRSRQTDSNLRNPKNFEFERTSFTTGLTPTGSEPSLQIQGVPDEKYNSDGDAHLSQFRPRSGWNHGQGSCLRRGFESGSTRRPRAKTLGTRSGSG